MSDEQHPEIVDIGLPATIVPTYATLVEISSGQLVNIHDPLARGMANRLLALEVENATLHGEIARLRGEVGYVATME